MVQDALQIRAVQHLEPGSTTSTTGKRNHQLNQSAFGHFHIYSRKAKAYFVFPTLHMQNHRCTFTVANKMPCEFASGDCQHREQWVTGWASSVEFTICLCNLQAQTQDTLDRLYRSSNHERQKVVVSTDTTYRMGHRQRGELSSCTILFWDGLRHVIRIVIENLHWLLDIGEFYQLLNPSKLELVCLKEVF